MMPKMLSLLVHLVCFTLLSLLVSASICSPSNYICSGRCPDVPPRLPLPNGVPICLKDSNTNACVCWLHGETNTVQSWFRCEAMINGTVTDISCQAPLQCFPPDAEPTCLVIPYCDCRLIKEDDSPEFQFGSWKPIKAVVELFNITLQIKTSETYSKDSQEFSIKHLLFLLGFVIAPLACWCLLNFINENKCKKCRNMSGDLESAPMNVDGRRVIDQNTSLVTAAVSDFHALITDGNNSTCQMPVQQLSGPFQPTVGVHSTLNTFDKQESPPSYDEAVSPESEEEGPPPSYADAIR